MSLLDDAIREHLELMRRRGADAADVARAEREALGIRSPEEEAREAAEAAGIMPAKPIGDPAAQETELARPEPAPSMAPYVEPPDFGRDAEAVPPAEARPAIEPSDEAPVGEIIHDAHAAPEPDPAPEAEAPAPPVDPETAERASQSTVAFSPEEVAAATAREEAESAAAAEAAAPVEPDESAYEPAPESAAAAPAAPPVHHEDEDYVYERDPEPREEAPDADATREHPAPPPREPAPREPEPREPAPASAADAPEDEPEDVLEETPDFLQETPEHDRLWFEQRPPRDFDF